MLFSGNSKSVISIYYGVYLVSIFYFNQLTIAISYSRYKPNKYKCILSCDLKFGQFLFFVKFYTKVGSSQSIFSPKFIISWTINLRRTENNWKSRDEKKSK